VVWNAVSSLPRATQAPDGSLLFDAFGPLSNGQAKMLKLNAEVDGASAPGTIANRAVATGVCADAPMRGDAETTTTVGAGLVPGVPVPAGSLAGNGRPSPHTSSAAGQSDSGSFASSVPVTRSAFAVAGEAESTTGSAPSGPAGAARTAGLLPHSGANPVPALMLSLTLLGSGRAFRRVKRRR
jgi:hypothetical protein